MDQQNQPPAGQQPQANNPFPNNAQVPNQPVPGATPQIVYVTRPMDPQPQHVSEQAKQRHEESKKAFPYLNLSEGEYVISAVKRHPIGLFQIWVVVGFVFALLFAVLAAVSAGVLQNDSGQDQFPIEVIAIPLLLLGMVALLFGFIETSIYNANKFFLTNESVIQYIQTSLFTKRQQTVSLGNVEDASYSQDGIIPSMFNYGQLRLSTEGDETTYRFAYASHPEQQIAVLNNAVEAFKNGRPVAE